MSERGKTPSFITSMSGKPKNTVAKRKRTCKRCKKEIQAGVKCIEVPQPGTLGARIYCQECTLKMIAKSREDLDQIEQSLRG